MAEATSRAAEFGVGAVGVHDSNHLGMLGHYTNQAREEGYVALAVTNTEPAMPPYGGASPVLGTNPIAIATPTDPPMNLDMSTSAISRGAVLRERERGGTLPEGVALDADGAPTTDPGAALDGVVLPFDGVKGAGLATAVELLAGGLVGAAMGEDVTGTYHTEEPCTKGDLFVALDPDLLGGPEAVDSMSAFLRDLTGVETAAGFDEVRVPGERSVRRADADRVEVDDEVWETALKLADT
jgi:L-2-hydroxycarboxylate dehydrogenase (NAD+)